MTETTPAEDNRYLGKSVIIRTRHFCFCADHTSAQAAHSIKHKFIRLFDKTGTIPEQPPAHHEKSVALRRPLLCKYLPALLQRHRVLPLCSRRRGVEHRNAPDRGPQCPEGGIQYALTRGEEIATFLTFYSKSLTLRLGSLMAG